VSELLSCEGLDAYPRTDAPTTAKSGPTPSIGKSQVDAMLPYLARYMGHATFDSTYYYIHTSPDFMDAYSGLVTGSPTLSGVL